MTAALAHEADRLLTGAFRSVWGRAPTPNELAILASHAWLEGRWGLAQFRSYPIGVPVGARRVCPPVGEEGVTLSPPLNNWGSVTTTSQDPAMAWGPACDSNARGIYPVMMKRYADRESGAVDYVRTATKLLGRDRLVMPALANGDVPAYVDAQLKTRYFLEAPGSMRADKIEGIAAGARQFASLAGIAYKPSSVGTTIEAVSSWLGLAGTLATAFAVAVAMGTGRKHNG